MQYRIKSLSLLATSLLTTSLMLAGMPAFAQEAKKVTLQDISWLAGCWKAKTGESTVDNLEQWMKPAGNVMLGIGVEMRSGKAVSYEYMRIEAKENGDLVYTVKPHNKAETPFKLTSNTAKTLVFENPKHDFPQRITYRQDKEGSMEMRIDGEVAGKKRAALYPVVKFSCE